jgi:hypothetical protein
MTKKNCREGTRPGWLPEESLETQFSARNNAGFLSDGCLLANGGAVEVNANRNASVVTLNNYLWTSSSARL